MSILGTIVSAVKAYSDANKKKKTSSGSSNKTSSSSSYKPVSLINLQTRDE